MPGPIVAALDLAEDAILAALSGLAPLTPAAWGVAPADTTRRLRLAVGDPQRLSGAIIVQHQDGGGIQANYLGVAGWEGLVTVRCISASDATARALRTAADGALAALAAPAGYALFADFVRPLPVLADGGITQRASIYRVAIRRVAPPPAFPAGMAARWTLDDAAAGRVDLIGGIALTATGAVTSGAGVIGAAAAFDGASSLIAPDAPALRLRAGFAVECWVRPAALSIAGIAGKSSADGDEWGLIHVGANIRWRVWDGDGTSNDVVGAGVLAADVWTHLVGVVEADRTIRLYVNGVEVGDPYALPALAAATPSALEAGAIGGGTLRLNGRLDELAIWHVALSPAQVAARYNDGLGRRP